MHDEFLMAKEFLSNIRNAKNEKIDQVTLEYYPGRDVKVIGPWTNKNLFNQNRTKVKIRNIENSEMELKTALKKIDFLNKNLMDTTAYYSFKDDFYDFFIQLPIKLEDIKNCICFCNSNGGTLETFNPKSEYGELKFSKSFHEYMLGNSIIPLEEKITFEQKKQFFFKIDHLDKNYVHIFFKCFDSHYQKNNLSYLNRFKMQEKFINK